MFDTEADKKIQEGMKAQARYTTYEILSLLVESNHPPVSTDHLKKLSDRIYTCLYSFRYCDQSKSAEEFLKRHIDDLRYEEWEPELMGGVD